MKAQHFLLSSIFLSMFILVLVHSAFYRQIYEAVFTVVVIAALASVCAGAAQEQAPLAAGLVVFFGGVFIAIELLGIIRHWHSNPLARQIGIVSAASLGLETTLCVWLILRRSSRNP